MREGRERHVHDHRGHHDRRDRRDLRGHHGLRDHRDLIVVIMIFVVIVIYRGHHDHRGRS